MHRERRAELAHEWRQRADRLDIYAARLRSDGDPQEAEEAENAAVDYRAAADVVDPLLGDESTNHGEVAALMDGAYTTYLAAAADELDDHPVMTPRAHSGAFGIPMPDPDEMCQLCNERVGVPQQCPSDRAHYRHGMIHARSRGMPLVWACAECCAREVAGQRP